MEALCTSLGECSGFAMDQPWQSKKRGFLLSYACTATGGGVLTFFKKSITQPPTCELGVGVELSGGYNEPVSIDSRIYTT
jgi:hypothetical protein